MSQWQTGLMVAVGLGLMALTAGYLATVQARQKLGPPGVRVVAVPLEGVETSSNGAPRVFVVAQQSVYLPTQVLEYASLPVPVDKVVLDWLPKDTTYGQRLYTATNDGFEIATTVILMGRDRTSIHQPEYCLLGSGWRITERTTDSIQVQEPVPYQLPVSKLLTIKHQRTSQGDLVPLRGVFVYWFVAGNEVAGDHLKRMWRLAWDMMRTGTLQRWAYVSCFAVCAPGEEEATWKRLSRFVAAAVPQFQLVPSPTNRPAGPSPNLAATPHLGAKDEP